MHADLLPATTPLPEGTLASCLLAPLDGADPVRLVLTADTGAPYVVETALDLQVERAAVAALVEFDGPRSEAQVAADRFASTHRVGPAAAQVEGTGGAVILRGADGAFVAVALANTAEALEASSRAILSTPLLPAEDPALLTEPSRFTACRVEGGADLVRALTSAVAR